jgi:DNA-binding protein H-NS
MTTTQAFESTHRDRPEGLASMPSSPGPLREELLTREGASGRVELAAAYGRLRATLLEAHSIEELGLEAWDEVAADVVTIRHALRERKRQNALETIASLSMEVEIDPSELGSYFEKSRQKRGHKKPTSGAVYRDPASGKTWRGHGPRPKWLRQWEEQGGDREQLLVSSQETQESGIKGQEVQA